VAELCIHLDGLPLALELAAARLKVLSPRAILERLQSRLDVLAPAAQDQPARHQTLRAALDWSYELLTDQEQRLLRALSVFVGGCTIEAGEAVCASDNIPREVVLNLLAQLVDKSLVVADIAADGSVRYRLLETIREYAHDGAVQHGEAELAVQRHAAYFYAQAQQAEGAVPGTYSPRALGQLARERDNLRAALRWCADNGQVEQGVRIGSALWEAVEHLLAESESARPAAPPSSGAMVAGPLSPREREVAVLLGRGYTNRQLADELVIAEGTAERHVANILNKLSLSSRAQVAVWAVEHGLLAAAVPGTGSAG